jgi:hypothetical protein
MAEEETVEPSSEETTGLLDSEQAVVEKEPENNETQISHLEGAEEPEKMEVPDYFPKQFWDEKKARTDD